MITFPRIESRKKRNNPKRIINSEKCDIIEEVW